MKDDPTKDHPSIWGKDGSQVLFKERYPVVLKTYEKWKSLNPLLEKYIRQQGDRINHKSNVKAQMTEWNMQLEAGGEHFQELVNWVREISIEVSPVQFIPDCYDCWGAVYKKGDWSKNHDHWPQIWSWVYNVECCDDCAPLVFHDSRDDNHSDHAYSLKPKSGRFTMFPGWIKHSVPKHDCDHDRIIVAGNISADPYHIIGFAQARDRERKTTK